MLVAALLPGAAAARPFQPGAAGFAHRPVCGAAPVRSARCHAEVVVDATGAPLAMAGPAGYGPADLQSAYGLTTRSAWSGGTQTIAIVDAYDDPSAEADLGVYRSQFGLPACTTANGCFRKVDQRGGTTYPQANGGWAQEISLDLDMASAICPRCRILLVEADSVFFTDLVAAVDRAAALGATQISNSYGGPEYSTETNDESHYNHPGIAVTVSSGDDGYGVEFPAASRYVTAVGGTHLQPDSSSRGWSETAWSGAGSGCSAYVPKPRWQKDAGCAHRTVADVSAVADPNTGVAVYDSFSYKGRSGWMVFGGTSAAAPIVAGFDALLGSDGASLSFAYDNPSLFSDVTSGSNGGCGGSYLCTARVGYDGPTGIGTPFGLTLAGAAPSATTGAATSVGETSATLNGTVDPNGAATQYHFAYGTTTAYGSLSPAVDASGNGTAVSADLTGLSAGTTYHYRLVATNAVGEAVGSDQTFTTLAGGSAGPNLTPATATTTTTPATSASASTSTGESGPPLPAPTLAVASHRRASVLRHGLRIVVGCSTGCSIAASLAADAKAAKRLRLSGHAPIVVSRTRHTLTAAGKVKLVLRLSRRARAALTRTRSVTLALRVVVTDPTGARHVLTRRVRIAS
jgi:subtilase family serine protease